MDYTTQHVSRFEQRQRIAKQNMRPGMIVYGQYKDRKGVSKPKCFLILNHFYLGKIHALSLSAVQHQRFISLARQTNLLYLTQPRYRALKIEQLQIDRGQRFYNSTLRSQLKQNLKGSYRTLEIKSLSNVFVVDYKFPKEIQILNEGEFRDED